MIEKKSSQQVRGPRIGRGGVEDWQKMLLLAEPDAAQGWRGNDVPQFSIGAAPPNSSYSIALVSRTTLNKLFLQQNCADACCGGQCREPSVSQRIHDSD